jgi:hypothetical protein
VLQVAWNRGLGGFSAPVGRKRPGLHRDEVDDAAEGLLFADRQLNGDDGAAEDAAQRFDRPIDAGALTVETVQNDDPGDLELFRSGPDFFRGHLRTVHGVDDDQRGVDDTKRGSRIAEEVGHPRRVDEVDFLSVPLGVGEAGRERVLAGDFFFVVVGDRSAVVHATEPVDGAGVEQQRSRQLCLPGAAMTDQRDVSDALGIVHLHRRVPSWVSGVC